MLGVISYVFLYLFEVLACFMFYENFYDRRVSKQLLFVAGCCSYAVQLLVMLLASYPLLNLISFIVCNFLIACFCYESKLRTCVFTTFMLTFFMLITELIVIYTTTELLGITSPFSWEENAFALVIQSSSSKLLFFVVIIIISRLFGRRQDSIQETGNVLLLCILPVTSILVFLTMTFWGIKIAPAADFDFALSVCSILLLFANIFVFYIYDKTQKTNYENKQLQLENQYADISVEFYEALSREYDNSRILIHDIKKHLNYIAAQAADNKPQQVLRYIDSITNEFGLYERIKYSGSEIVDAVINRYVHLCKNASVSFEIEPLTTGLDFMDEYDVVALLGNLLDNAVEAAEKASEPRITMGIHNVSERISVIRISNTCSNPPKAIRGRLLTGKADGRIGHGVGTTSIIRIAEKYNGDFSWDYSADTKTFTASVFVQGGQDKDEHSNM